MYTVVITCYSFVTGLGPNSTLTVNQVNTNDNDLKEAIITTLI